MFFIKNKGSLNRRIGRFFFFALMVLNREFKRRFFRKILIFLAQILYGPYRYTRWYIMFIENGISRYNVVEQSYLVRDENPFFYVDRNALYSANLERRWYVLIREIFELYIGKRKKPSVVLLSSLKYYFKKCKVDLFNAFLYRIYNFFFFKLKFFVAFFLYDLSALF